MDIFLVFLVLYWFACTIFEINVCDDWDDIISTPRDIYNNGAVNWFGATLLFTLLLVSSPFLRIVKLVVWLFTVGQKD